MNKKFKAIIAGTMAIATATTMAFSASAYSANSSNINNVNIGSAGTNGGYTWHTEAIQSQYIELSKSFLSGGPKTITMAKTSGYNTQMVAMLDKSITSFEEAAGYVQNLTIKNAKGQTLLCKVERDRYTGRFGLRAFDISQVAYNVNKSVTSGSRVEVKYTLKGLWVGSNFNVYVSNVTYTGGGEGYKANGRDGFDEADWYTYYKFESNAVLSFRKNQTLTFDAILDKNGKQRNLTRVTYKTTIGSRGVEYAKANSKINCFDFAFGFIDTDQNALNNAGCKVISDYSAFYQRISKTLEYTDEEVLDMLTEATIKDFKDACPTGSIRVVSGYDAELKDGEWLVAMRFGRAIKKYTHVDNGSIDYQPWFDYHYMYRASNGKWYTKHGYVEASEECSGNIINPSIDATDGWASEDVVEPEISAETGYYNSETVYFAVKK